jgi:hypothetical protein
MKGRELRTIMGVILMLLSPIFVVTTMIFGPNTPVTSWLEIVHVLLYPVLLFLSGFALFNRTAFNDVVRAGRRFTRRRREDR